MCFQRVVEHRVCGLDCGHQRVSQQRLQRELPIAGQGGVDGEFLLPGSRAENVRDSFR